MNMITEQKLELNDAAQAVLDQLLNNESLQAEADGYARAVLERFGADQTHLLDEEHEDALVNRLYYKFMNDHWRNVLIKAASML